MPKAVFDLPGSLSSGSICAAVGVLAIGETEGLLVAVGESAQHSNV